jgi:hypothetical protein
MVVSVAETPGQATRPKAREIGWCGFAAPTPHSLPIGRYVMATAEHREPCDSRGSCTVLGAPGGEIPPGDSSKRRSWPCPSTVRFALHCGRHAAPPRNLALGQLHTHAPQYERKKKDRLAAIFPKSDPVFDQAAAIASASFRFLRQPSRPITPRPVAKSGRAAGRGVASTSDWNVAGYKPPPKPTM